MAWLGELDGETRVERSGHVEEGENGWHARLIHIWVVRAQRLRMDVAYGSPVGGIWIGYNGVSLTHFG
jgi:hypothetical protein